MAHFAFGSNGPYELEAFSHPGRRPIAVVSPPGPKAVLLWPSPDAYEAATMALIILTGASGSGKTTIAERIEQQRVDQVRVFRFDSIGVPSPEERVAGWGSGSGWQRAMTIEWLLRIARQPDVFPILFEGQMRLSFIKEGLATAGIGEARLLLVDCDDATRTHRLRNERKQPELANAEMMNWAKFLRDEAETGGFELLDTSKISIEESVEYVLGTGPRSGR